MNGSIQRITSYLAPLAGRGRIALAIRVRGTLRALHYVLNTLIEEPLTPTLSPQKRGEGAQRARGDLP